MTSSRRQSATSETSRASYLSRPQKLLLGLVILATCVVVVILPIVLVKNRDANNNSNSNKNTGENYLALLVHDVNDRSDGTDVILLEGADERETSLKQALRRTTTHTTDIISSSSSLAPTNLDGDTDDELLVVFSDAALSDIFDSTSDPSVANTTFSSFINTGIPTAAPTTSAGTASITPRPTPAPTLSPATAAPTPPRIVQRVNSYTVLESIAHDPDAFTQGLTFDPEDSSLVYESTGLYGESDVRHVNIETGEVLMIRSTPAEIFGEGLAYFTTNDNNNAGRLIHITWKSQRGFIFDANNLEMVREFQFSTTNNEGWGITYHPIRDQFFVTDGSSNLHVWDRNLNEVERIPVTARYNTNSDAPVAISNLNEIEWDAATDTILSNVWQEDIIVRIDPNSGEVITQYDLSDLVGRQTFGSNVLNGIAITGGENPDLWITGKLWRTMYRIQFNE